jgi:hypothetical protein
MLTLNMIPTENRNMIQFKKRLLLNCLPHDLEIITVNGGESTSQYYTLLHVAKFSGKQKKLSPVILQPHHVSRITTQLFSTLIHGASCFVYKLHKVGS